MNPMYATLLDDVDVDRSILEWNDKTFRTDDASIYDGVLQKADTYNIKSKDSEKWQLFGESYLKIVFSLVNSPPTTPMADGQVKTLISGGLHLFDQARLIIDDNQVEFIDKPGYVQLIESLYNSSLDKLESLAENEWMYADSGNIALGAYTPAVLKAGNTGAPFINSQAFAGASTHVNEFWGLADPVQHIGVDTTGAGIGGMNPKFNSSYASRWRRTRAGRDVELAIPIKNLFGFFADIRNAFRGVAFEIELRKNKNWGEILHGQGATTTGDGTTTVAVAGALDAETLIKSIEWYVPTVMPSVLQLEDVQRQLQSGERIKKIFNSTTTFIRPAETTAVITPLDFRIQQTGKKISKVVVAFQREDQYLSQTDSDYTTTTDTHSNGGVFTHFVNIPTIELRRGSTILPKERYQRMSFKDADSNFSRNYVDFLRAGSLWNTSEDGSIVSYEAFRNLYPMFTFDMSDMETPLETSEDLRVVAEIETAGAGNKFRVIVFVQSEYVAEFVAVDGRLAIEIP